MKRIVCISQPRYLPSASYLHRFYLADVFVYLDTVQYTPRDWENRNRIKGPNGAQWLTVPVVRERRDQPIATTRIDAAQQWAGKHLAALRTCYGKAPSFDTHFPWLERALTQPWELLPELNASLTAQLNERLGFECETVSASSLGVSGAGQDLLIDIVRAVGGDAYLSGPLGRDYIEPDAFRTAAIDLVYHDYEAVEYPQRFGAFQPMLSVVDILFNCTPDESRDVVRAGGRDTERLLGRIGER